LSHCKVFQCIEDRESPAGRFVWSLTALTCTPRHLELPPYVPRHSPGNSFLFFSSYILLICWNHINMSEEDKNVRTRNVRSAICRMRLTRIQTTSSKPLAALNSPTSLRAESPTTARPLDFDDEPQESGVTTSSPAATQPAPAEDAPPKPPRPLSPREQSEITLKEAFPSVEPGVVKAILTASNWNVERAFNALLGPWI
jgi:hypothetical protein